MKIEVIATAKDRKSGEIEAVSFSVTGAKDLKPTIPFLVQEVLDTLEIENVNDFNLNIKCEY